MKYTNEHLAKMVDPLLRHPAMTDQEVIHGCRPAAKSKVASVCIKPCAAKRFWGAAAALFCLIVVPAAPAGERKLARLRVSANQRFLVTADDQPFFWLGDTAWELFHRLNREEATRYLEDRAGKGFTIIQAVALAELDGLNTPNAYGHRPLVDNNHTRPDVKDEPANDYWDHVDFVVRHARTLIESGPCFDRMPDPSLVVPPNASGPDYVAACRAPNARYALIYFPSGKPATLRTFLLKGPRLAARWFDPRTGRCQDLPYVEVAPWKTTEFEPPVADQDWVLVLATKP